MSPDLSAFRAAGGKLIQYHGFADSIVPPRESIDYYERVQAAEDGGKPPRGTRSRTSIACSSRRASITARAGPAQTCSMCRAPSSVGSSGVSRPTRSPRQSKPLRQAPRGDSNESRALPPTEEGALQRRWRSSGGVEFLLHRRGALSEPPAFHRLSSLIVAPHFARRLVHGGRRKWCGEGCSTRR
jgi:hypothetical protein